jgi:glycosyltransferase involved in cell wall biosynthesis
MIKLLSFGAPHSGKDLEVVFSAVKESDGVHLVHAGTHVYSLGNNPVALKKKYELDDSKCIVANRFVSEDEKKALFQSCDAVILSYTKEFASESSVLWEAVKWGKGVIANQENQLGKDVYFYKLGELFEAGNKDELVKAIRRFKDVGQYKEGQDRFLIDHSRAEWRRKYMELFEKMNAGVS